MNPLLCYIRARLQRRLFMWFGATIFLTGIVIASVMGSMSGGDAGFRRETRRVHAFVAGRFEQVWDSPVSRDELAMAISRDLDITVVLQGPDHTPLVSMGGSCRGHFPTIAVTRAGRAIGHVGVCADRYRWHAWRAFMPLFVTALLLWTASGALARRLSRPMMELARVARELGAGRLSARVRLKHGHRFGEVEALAFTMNDMAARLERHLAQQRELLAAVSHELRTPLARIRLLTEMARGTASLDKTLDDLDREVIEMDALVGDLLASSRMDFAELSRQRLEAVEIASRALERAGADPAALAVERLPTAEDAQPIPLAADATLLARALANLIDNARKHGGGVELFKVRQAEGCVAFEVEDHGEGFAPGEEGRIFEPFYRRSDRGSLGLGLALVKRIAEAHGGRAYAENRAEGGARVGIELPVTG